MWSYELSNGYKPKRQFNTKEEMIFDIAVMLRYNYKSYDPDIHADVIIYKDEILDEVINGEAFNDEDN